ncbi:hypothetical protein P3W24_04085 [Luteibacter sp. PPL201]|jgi:hypothetical protein|uniref:Uncharacterized protein n=1 Tax=Luteibacter sahnii TaxID=3021977 RepID=A0ABT6B7U5_9GAMM|nr:hypothetical protein [Luteibacter sp. PPL193]MDY1547949.1 hypothetical protein [Luteibacter sp. PPL193]
MPAESFRLISVDEVDVLYKGGYYRLVASGELNEEDMTVELANAKLLDDQNNIFKQLPRQRLEAVSNELGSQHDWLKKRVMELF